MKKIPSLLGCLLISYYSFSQVTDSARHIVLTDVVVSAKKSEAGNYKKKARSFNSHFIITPGRKDDGHEVYLATHCAPLSSAAIKLYGLELKLAPYDTSLFSIKVMIVQVQAGGDTMFTTLVVNGEDIKHKRMFMDVKDRNIILEASAFYIGYAFIPTKKLVDKYQYRIYQNDNNDGAIILLKNGKVHFGNESPFNYNFPFKASYITL